MAAAATGNYQVLSNDVPMLLKEPRIPLEGGVIMEGFLEEVGSFQGVLGPRLALSAYGRHKREKNLSVKLSPQIYSPRLRVLLLGKYTRTPHVHTHTHTPQIKR